MPRAKTNKLYRTFTKGLITEAGYLTYPEDASTDELNTIISRKGNRTRRQGIRYEDNCVLNNVAVGPSDAISEFVWHSAAKDAGRMFTVAQIGSVIHFWAMDSVPVSDNKKPFTVNLTPNKAPGASGLDLSTNRCQFASGAGFLFIAHPFCEPLCIEYDPVTDTITPIRVVIQIRDFEGVYDGLANDQEPGDLSIEHEYNLLNQGWLAPGVVPAPALALGENADVPGGGGGSGTGEVGNETGTPVGGVGGPGTYFDPYTGEEKPYYRYRSGDYAGNVSYE